MSKKVENIRVKGGMRRYREQQQQQQQPELTGGSPAALRRAAMASIQPAYDRDPLPQPDPDDIDPVYAADDTPDPVKRKSRRMLAAMVTIQLIAIGGIVAYQKAKPPAETTKPDSGKLANPRLPVTPMPPGVEITPPPAKVVTTHIVVAGDTWSDLALANDLREEELRAANPNTGELYVGLPLSIPPRKNVISARGKEDTTVPQVVSSDPSQGPGPTAFTVNEDPAHYSGLVVPGRPQDTAKDVVKVNPGELETQKIQPTPQPANARLVLPGNIPDPVPTAQIPPAVINPSVLTGERPVAPPIPTPAPTAPPRAKIVREDDTPRTPAAPPRAKIVDESASTDSTLRNSQTGSPQRINSTNRRSVLVQKGETLFSISRRLGISVEELKAINGLTTDTIVEGRTLRGPED